MWVNTGLFRVKMNSSSLLLPLSPQDSAIPSYVIRVGQKQQWVGTEIWNHVLWNQYASWSRKSKQHKFLGKWPCLLAIITVNENSSDSWVWHVFLPTPLWCLLLYLFLAHSCMTSMTVIADQLKDACYKTISDFFDYLLEFSPFLPSFIFSFVLYLPGRGVTVTIEFPCTVHMLTPRFLQIWGIPLHSFGSCIHIHLYYLKNVINVFFVK